MSTYIPYGDIFMTKTKKEAGIAPDTQWGELPDNCESVIVNN